MIPFAGAFRCSLPELLPFCPVEKIPTYSAAKHFGLVYFSGISTPKNVGICEDLGFTQYSQILSNILLKKYSTMMESF
jgi:hypothetical protein